MWNFHFIFLSFLRMIVIKLSSNAMKIQFYSRDTYWKILNCHVEIRGIEGICGWQI